MNVTFCENNPSSEVTKMNCKNCGDYVSLITLVCQLCGEDYNPPEEEFESFFID